MEESRPEIKNEPKCFIAENSSLKKKRTKSAHKKISNEKRLQLIEMVKYNKLG